MTINTITAVSILIPVKAQRRPSESRLTAGERRKITESLARPWRVMKGRVPQLVLLISLSLIAGCATRQDVPPAVAPGSLVFDHVNVVPMTGNLVLRDMTVVVQGETIAAVVPSGTWAFPADTQVIDGAGRWLVPGLVDAHVHTVGPESITRRLFLLGLAKGVTTAVVMVGDEMPLELREKYRRGTDLGPTLYVASPKVEEPAMTFAEGEALVERYRASGYDLIKVYNDLSKDGYRGVIRAAREHEMPVVGHVVRSLDLEGVLGAGQRGIAHMEEYLYSYLGLVTTDTSQVASDVLDEEAIEYLAAITAQSGTYVTPTLVAYERMVALSEDLERAMDTPGMEYLGEGLRGALHRHGKTTYADRFADPSNQDKLRAALAFQRRMTGAFHRAGVPLVAGTDAPIAVTMPGYGMQRELRNLVDAGLTPLEALKTATMNAAQYLGKSSEFGSIEIGKRADFLLLAENPLDDIGNIATIEGITVRGKWLGENSLTSLLEELQKDQP